MHTHTCTHIDTHMHTHTQTHAHTQTHRHTDTDTHTRVLTSHPQKRCTWAAWCQWGLWRRGLCCMWCVCVCSISHSDVDQCVCMCVCVCVTGSGPDSLDMSSQASSSTLLIILWGRKQHHLNNGVAVGVKLAHQGLHEPDSVVLSNSRAKGALESLYWHPLSHYTLARKFN
jgi:hypothetical protein